MKDSLFPKAIYFCVFLFIATGVYSQSLQDYLQIAAEQNPELKSRYLQFEAALQKVPQVGALPDPMFSAAVIANRMVPQERAQLTLRQLFPWFGTLEARKDAAAAMAQVQFMAWQDSRNTLFFEIKKIYYEVYEVEKNIEIIIGKLKYYDSYEQLAQAKFQAGSGPMVDVVRVQIERNELNTDLQLFKDRRYPLQFLFNKLLNRASEEAIFLPDTLLLPDFYAWTTPDSLSANPKIKTLEAERRAFELQQKVVAKERLPMIELGLQYMIMPQSEMDAGNDMLMPMVGVSLPIWRKKYDAIEQETILMQQSAEQMKKNVINNLESQWAQARYDLDNARQRLELFTKQTEATATALELLMAAYANSGADFAEVLRTEQMLLQYRLLSEAARKDYLIAYAQLEYLAAKNLINE